MQQLNMAEKYLKFLLMKFTGTIRTTVFVINIHNKLYLIYSSTFHI